MTSASATIIFDTGSQSSFAAQPFIRLEQAMEFEQNETVTMFDIQQMVTRAKAGMSARTYKPAGCSGYIDGESVVVEFTFYAWPSAMNFPYTIRSSFGEVSKPVVVEKDVEFSVVFEKSDSVVFDFIISDVKSIKWETPCYNSFGAVIDVDDPYMDGDRIIRINKPCFGVCRIKATKIGYQHFLSTRLLKYVPAPVDGAQPAKKYYQDSGANTYYTYQDWLEKYFFTSDFNSEDSTNTDDVDNSMLNMTGIKISNLNITVTAMWMVGDKEKTCAISLEVPDCVKDFLEMCGTDDGTGSPDGPLGSGLFGNEFFCLNPAGDVKTNVYVSGCDGRVIMTEPVDKDKNSWCGK